MQLDENYQFDFLVIPTLTFQKKLLFYNFGKEIFQQDLFAKSHCKKINFSKLSDLFFLLTMVYQLSENWFFKDMFNVTI